MPLLNVALVPAPDQVVVRLTGEADLSSAAPLGDALAHAHRLGTPRVVVDVAAVRFWDLSGLYALIELTADLAAEGRSCRIVGAPAATRRLIELACLGGGLHLDGPVQQLPSTATTVAPAELPAARHPVAEHGVPPRPLPAGDLALVGARQAPERRGWRRRA